MALLFLAFSIKAHRTPHALAISLIIIWHTSLTEVAPCAAVINSKAVAFKRSCISHVDSDYIAFICTPSGVKSSGLM